jgi:hypothetical protein
MNALGLLARHRGTRTWRSVSVPLCAVSGLWLCLALGLGCLNPIPDDLPGNTSGAPPAPPLANAPATSEPAPDGTPASGQPPEEASPSPSSGSSESAGGDQNSTIGVVNDEAGDAGVSDAAATVDAAEAEIP